MIKIDAIGDSCPIPVVKTKKAINEVNGAETIEVLVDNEIAVQNVSKFGISSGGSISSQQLGDKKYKVTIQMGAPDSNASIRAEEVITVSGGSSIIVISSNQMGEGDDKLGKVLLKGFIFAVTQSADLPKKILFYNSGALVTCEDSDSLEDLKALVKQGVEVLTCGTCLDFYHLKDKLAVGSVTNMYDIVESMNNASKIITP